jgi:hypothetical protein
MSASQKGQIGVNAGRVQSRMYKFLKEAKSELDPSNYSSLIEILVKYQTGNILWDYRAKSRL